MSNRKAVTKPRSMIAGDDVERRLAVLEDRVRRMPVRPVSHAATATTFMVQQTTHGLAVKDVVRHNGTSWTKSQADTAANAVVGGMVIAVLSPDVFIVATPGSYVSGLSGLTAGAVHYLDASTAGALTTTAPTIAVPVLHADSTTSGVLMAAWPGGGVANATDGGFVYASSGTTPYPGEWTKTLDLGTGHRTATATVGAIDIAISTDGDAVLISDAADGIEIYDRSVSTTVPVLKIKTTPEITIGNTSVAGSATIGNTTAADAIVISPTLVTSTGKKIAIREEDVCDGGVAKKRLILASAPY